MKETGNYRPDTVTVRRDWGRNIMTVNTDVKEVDGGFEWISVELPPGRWGYSLIVSALVNERFPASSVDAILNNCLSGLGNDSITEFKALQQWRSRAKELAREALVWAAEHGIAQDELEPDEEQAVPTGTETHPDGLSMLQQAVTLLKTQVEDLPDEQAMTVPALFPAWADFIGQQVETGKRLFYGGRLYKVLQDHTAQADWTPDLTPALYTEVAADQEQGTLDNPIPYNNNMELEEGKYYSQYDVTYLCIRSTGVPVYNNLADLVHIYVEVAP